MCECFIERVDHRVSWQWAVATVQPFPHPSVGRKLEQRVYECVFDTGAALCVWEQEDQRSHSCYIKQDFPKQRASATEFPKSSSGFPLQQKLSGFTESRLFVLEHHCSGAAEAMSQHRRHSAHLPCIAQLLNVWLLLYHLAFPDGIYRSKTHSHTPMIGPWLAAGEPPFLCINPMVNDHRHCHPHTL